MNIFLSWSKSKSQEIALAIKSFLNGLFRDEINVWMSSESISYGSTSIPEINKALINSDKCIAIITSDNILSPWIMYETGAVLARNLVAFPNKDNNEFIIPIIFENVDNKKFMGNPINQFQRLQYSKATLKRLVTQLNQETHTFSDIKTLETQFNLNWNILNKEIKNCLKKYTLYNKRPLTCGLLTETLEQAGFPVPCLGDITLYESGFETQKLYEIILNSAEKRLWVFGRKNRKLFSTENREFFSKLSEKQENGFDFKCLFLNPLNLDAQVNAQRIPHFTQKLNICIDDARNILENNDVNFNSVCKFYDCNRTEHLIIVDNVVLCSNISYANDDFPLPLTKAPFYITEVDNSIGRNFVHKFNNVWKEAVNIDFVTF